MVKICDAIMGSGKSSAAITYMNEHPEERFIYITPYIDEAARIQDACPRLRFVLPSKRIAECGFSKVGHTLRLLKEGKNVATTHQAFRYYTREVLDVIRETGYTLIIDESVMVLEEYRMSRADIDLLTAAGQIVECREGYKLGNATYGGGALSEVYRLMQSRNLLRTTNEQQDREILYWALPPELIQSFKDVYVLTYLFDGQDMHHFLKMYDIPYSRIGVVKRNGVYRFSEIEAEMPAYAKTLSQHIHILDHKKLNSIGEDRFALSMNWFRKKEGVEQLKKNIYNYFCNIERKTPFSLKMWGTYKDARAMLRGKGYSNQYVCFNDRATNRYRDRTVLVYAVNLFMNGGQKRFYQRMGVEASDDAYAVSTMVQWIWRSAIRDGRDIWIYIPSKRMRTLLIQWINDVEREYQEYERASGEAPDENAEAA